MARSFGMSGSWSGAVINLAAARQYVTPFGVMLDTTAGGVAPFAQADWPNARRVVASEAFTHQDWQLAQPATLRGQDTFFTGPGRGPVYDWPNPIRPPPRQDMSGFVAFAALYSPTLPLRQQDWPNPRAPRQVRQDTSAVAFAGLANVTSPFRQSEWPLPTRRAHAISLRTHTSPLRLNLLGQDKFFGPPGMGPRYDWPVTPRLRPLLPEVGYFDIVNFPPSRPPPVPRARMVTAYSGVRMAVAHAPIDLSANRIVVVPAQDRTVVPQIRADTPPED